MDRFRVRGVDPLCKYLWVSVLVVPDVRTLQSLEAPRRRTKDQLAAFIDSGHAYYRKQRGCIGGIELALGPRLESTAMHESIHAAFAVSRYRRRWPVDEFEREEFIVSTAEYIFKQIQKRFRERNYYR